MQTLSAKDAKLVIGRLIDLARTEPLGVANWLRRCRGALGGEYERLKTPDAPKPVQEREERE